MGLFSLFSGERALARFLVKALARAADAERLRTLPKGATQHIKGVARGLKLFGRRWELGLTLTAEDDPE